MSNYSRVNPTENHLNSTIAGVKEYEKGIYLNNNNNNQMNSPKQNTTNVNNNTKINKDKNELNNNSLYNKDNNGPEQNEMNNQTYQNLNHHSHFQDKNKMQIDNYSSKDKRIEKTRIIKEQNQNNNQFNNKVHIPVIDLNNPNPSCISSYTPIIDKNESNTIKNIVEIFYTNYERYKDQQINEKRTLSSMINSEIKQKLGGEWFVFVSKKNDKISFNLSTVSQSDFLIIDIGNSQFKIAKTK